MAQSQNNKKSRRRVIIVATAVLLFAFYVFQQMTGFQLPFFSSSSEEGVAQGSMQKAVQACKSLLRSEMGNLLLQADVDPISTRYEGGSKEYRVFINVMLRGIEREDTYVECRVSAVTQEIREFRLNNSSIRFEQIEI